MRTKGTILSILCIPVAFAGCVQQYVWVDRVVVPAFDHTFIEDIAVVEFVNRSSDPYAGKTVADRMEELLVNESPYRVVPRQVLAELDLPVGGRIDSAKIKKIGRVAGVEAVVLGTVETYEIREAKLKAGIGDWLVKRSQGPKVSREASVLMYIKVVKTATGQVVWSKSAGGARSWTGRVGPFTTTGRSELLEEAVDEAVAEVRSLFPHKERVKEPVNK